MDRIDRKILEVLQEDADLSFAEIGKRVGLTANPCCRRIQKMEASGVIKRRVAILDSQHVNSTVTAFVSIRVGEHLNEWVTQFVQKVSDLPEVVSVYRMSGNADYLLRILLPDASAYTAFHKRLINGVRANQVSVVFPIERLKHTTSLPLDYMVID